MCFGDVSHDPSCQGISVLLSTPRFLSFLHVIALCKAMSQLLINKSRRPNFPAHNRQLSFRHVNPRADSRVHVWGDRLVKTMRGWSSSSSGHQGGQGSSWWPGLALGIQEGALTCQPRGKAAARSGPRGWQRLSASILRGHTSFCKLALAGRLVQMEE